MDQVLPYLPLIGMLLVAGSCAGIMAGLLGVGGGIVIVPVLDAGLITVGVDPSISLHIAIATSLATIVATSLSSARSHYRRGAVDALFLRRWGPWIAMGAVAGTLLASSLSGYALAVLFGSVAVLMAVRMMVPLDDLRLSDGPPGIPWGALVPAAIGGLSSMLGIGGGTFSVPALTLCGLSVHRAVGTAAAIGMLIALPGALAYVVNGWGLPGLPGASMGYVNLAGLAVIAPASVLMAPLGARLAHRLSKRQLTVVFGAFLMVVGVRMLWRALL